MAYCAALIHLSDIEAGPKSRTHRPDDVVECWKKAAEKLVDDARRQLIELRQIDPARIGLVIAGDSTARGKRVEFEEAARVIKHIRDRLGIQENHVAIVPGNHDVDWDECERVFWTATPLSNPQDPAVRKSVCGAAEKLHGFRWLVKDVCGIEFSGPETVLAFPGFADLGLAVVGFDTTYPCTFNDEDNYGCLRDDTIVQQGKAVLRQLRAHNPDLLPLALMHHCPNPRKDHNPKDMSYFRNAEQALVWLRAAGFQMILCGHEHQARTIAELRSQYLIFTAGAYGPDIRGLQQDRGGPSSIESNRYQMLLFTDTEGGELLLRKLNPPGAFDGKWEDDDDAGPACVAVPLRLGTLGNEPLTLAVSHPFRLPGRESFVVAVSLKATPQQLGVISGVEYRLGAREWKASHAASHFFVEMEIDRVQGQTVIAKISTNTESCQLTAPVPLPLPEEDGI